MALGLTAPVGDKKRITQPDPKKKNQKFAAVSNKPDDVKLVQLMLIANGYTVPVDGKVSSGLIKAIKAFQSGKCKFKKPDGIIDPGMKTWAAGLPKLSAKIAADAKVDVVEVTEKGKTKYIPRKEFEQQQKALLRKIENKANMMLGQADTWLDFCKDAEATLLGAETFMNSMVEFTVRWANEKAEPPYGPLNAAHSEALFLKNAVTASKPNWDRIAKQEAKAAKAYNKGVKAWNTFIDARIGTAGKFLTAATVTSEVSFAVVEVYMTARITVTRGMPPWQAHAVAAAGTEAMKSSAGEVGEYLAGNKVTFGGSAKKIVINSLFAGAAGAVGGKIGSAFLNGAATKLAAKLSAKFTSRLSTKAIELFFKKFLATGPGQAMVENAAKEAVGLFKKTVEKGKAPSQKDFEEAVLKIMVGSALGSKAAKSLSAWDMKVPAKTQAFLTDNLTPKTLEAVKKGLAKDYGKQLVSDVSGKIYAEIVGKVKGGFLNKSVEQGVLYASSRFTGDQTEGQLQKLTEEGIKRDAALQKEIRSFIEKELRKELEAQKVSQ